MIENRIVIVCWYKSNNKYNCIEIVKNIFINKGYEVECYPFMQIKNNNKKNHINIFEKELKDFDPKYVLFWNWSSISGNELRYIKNNNYERIFMVYNWDDPHCWNRNLDFMKYFDISYSSCFGTLNNYKKLGIKVSRYLLPGYSSISHYYDKDDKYKCDVSFMCTNLYRKTQKDYDTNVLVDRESLIRKLEEHPNINFNIYGPEFLKQIAPKSYRGFIGYEKNRLVFSNSKININVHGANDDGYLNERSITILGCGGLMLIDNLKGINRNLKNNENCIIIKDNNSDKIVKQIEEILENYDKYNNIRKNANDLARNRFSYNLWVDEIIDGMKEYNSNYREYKNIKYTELAMGIYLDAYIDLNKMIEMRERFNIINNKNKVSWVISYDLIKLTYTFVSSTVNIINDFVNKYGDTVSIGFGFMNHRIPMETMIEQIKKIEDIYTNILLLGDKVESNKLFENVPENMKPKSIMSYSISQYQIEWIKNNLGITNFMCWTATQTNVDGFSGEGTILSPYYTHINNPMVPSNNDSNSSGCLMLNTISVDPIGCRHTTGESRWTIHPADPMTDGYSQIMLFRRYLSNPFFKKNHFNYMSLFLDITWILTNKNLYNSWDIILNFLQSVSFKINSIDGVCNNYRKKYSNNDNINFILEIDGLGYEKNGKKSEKEKTYLWYEDKNNRIIYEKTDDKYKVIDFTDYNRNIKPLKQLSDTNYITGKNYKLLTDVELTEQEIKKSNSIINEHT